jgi:ABC-type uncharacterized transport system YnjBCD substrate-binding protein
MSVGLFIYDIFTYSNQYENKPNYEILTTFCKKNPNRFDYTQNL